MILLIIVWWRSRICSAVRGTVVWDRLVVFRAGLYVGQGRLRAKSGRSRPVGELINFDRYFISYACGVWASHESVSLTVASEVVRLPEKSRKSSLRAIGKGGSVSKSRRGWSRGFMLLNYNRITAVIIVSFGFFEPASANTGKLGTSAMGPTAKQASIVEKVQQQPSMEERTRLRNLTCQRMHAGCLRGYRRDGPRVRFCNRYLRTQGC